MPCATSPSAMACTSSGCMPQNSAIWVKVSAVFSISHTAVAFGISGRVMVYTLSGSPADVIHSDDVSCVESIALEESQPQLSGGYDNPRGVGQATSALLFCPGRA